MNSLGLAAVFCVAVAAASAGLHAGIVAGVGTPAVIAGPSGAVIRSGVAHGGVVTGVAHGGIVAGVPGIYGLGLGHGAAGAIIAPATAAGAVIAPGLGLVGHGLLAPGSGLEGQYVHDHSELLYDDGSYKPHVYGH